ncbi:hypothetical protein CR513_42457 [Mucuna pruriens]|uniref:Uncharacterized protein n=1 Tax=Mucuna pruriens TaxID=157652 RepID=A0A371FGM3_MUCPR|nr:hypothetical protein CR513_42457 [Mucuna pruriens]
MRRRLDTMDDSDFSQPPMDTSSQSLPFVVNAALLLFVILFGLSNIFLCYY